ncbi:MAG: nickel pincer cofactor biosynthesis protein LarB [Phycisphaerae bacterium]
MNRETLRDLLQAVGAGETSVEDALARLETFPSEALPFARIDHHRSLRCGFPEVIYCPGKTDEQIAEIFDRLRAAGGNVLATRATADQFLAVRRRVPGVAHHETARCITLRQAPAKETTGVIAIVAAGTTDLPVAEEAQVTCEIMDQRTQLITDVGVAGVHRLLSHAEMLRAARVVVAVAGMDGALPGVVAGLVRGPVIAVPTSVGYGASFAGVAPLLTMLNACAPGVGVVNIDNGFGAGYLAAIINQIGETGPD